MENDEWWRGNSLAFQRMFQQTSPSQGSIRLHRHFFFSFLFSFAQGALALGLRRLTSLLPCHHWLDRFFFSALASFILLTLFYFPWLTPVFEGTILEIACTAVGLPPCTATEEKKANGHAYLLTYYYVPYYYSADLFWTPQLIKIQDDLIKLNILHGSDMHRTWIIKDCPRDSTPFNSLPQARNWSDFPHGRNMMKKKGAIRGFITQPVLVHP